MKKNIFITGFIFILLFVVLKFVVFSEKKNHILNENLAVEQSLIEEGLELKRFPLDVKKIDEVDAPSFSIRAEEIKEKVKTHCEYENFDLNLVLLKEKLDLSLEEHYVSSFIEKNVKIFISRFYNNNYIEFLSKTIVDETSIYKYRVEMVTTIEIEVYTGGFFSKNKCISEKYIYTSDGIFNTINELIL